MMRGEELLQLLQVAAYPWQKEAAASSIFSDFQKMAERGREDFEPPVYDTSGAADRSQQDSAWARLRQFAARARWSNKT